MHRNRVLKLTVLAALILVPAATAMAESFKVTLDTSPLSGPQILAFGLTDGDGVSDNTLTLTGFDFGGGAAVSLTEDCTLGGTLSGLGCSGNLTSGVTLEDLDFVAFFTQQFDPGSSLSFILTTTNNFAGGTPDQFATFLCNGSFSACYSDDAATGAMLLLNLVGGPLSPSDFILVGASDQSLDAPLVTAVPEPGSLVLLGLGLAVAALRGRRLCGTSDTKGKPV